jgi:NACalpha-BTF3-like transcription factor
MEILKQEIQDCEFGSMSFHQYVSIRQFVLHAHENPVPQDPVPEEPVPADVDGIPGIDISLVSRQAGVSHEQSLEALRRNNGDIINSIMELVN